MKSKKFKLSIEDIKEYDIFPVINIINDFTIVQRITEHIQIIMSNIGYYKIKFKIKNEELDKVLEDIYILSYDLLLFSIKDPMNDDEMEEFDDWFTELINDLQDIHNRFNYVKKSLNNKFVEIIDESIFILNQLSNDISEYFKNQYEILLESGEEDIQDDLV